MGRKITDSVTWVGKVDWELKKFHGEDYSTHRGSSYNAYLIRDEKTALIDTVWAPFAEEFVENLKKEIDLSEIDYVIANHGEIDHSGGLVALMKEIPGTPIYCTANAVKSLKGQFHKDWNFVTVRTGDTLNLGSKVLTFIEAPMLHWPDSMFSYLDGDAILFSNDAFGQHYATELLYNDLVDQAELFQEAVKYYANILTPFSRLVIKKIEEVLSFNLPLNIICPSHGVIWREDPAQIVKKYLEWADNYQEDQVTIVYDTMWEGTRKMAEAIAEGIASASGSTAVKLFNAGKIDKNDIVTELFKAKAVLFGSPTVNKGILAPLSGMLHEVKGLSFKSKKAAVFGTYGWSGESVDVLTKMVEDGGFEIVQPGLKKLWSPDEGSLDDCREFGSEFAAKI
ncbi:MULTISPECIES: anaerobic nitric oxide reductase flavorubredoxin [Mesotoga]|uniref:anaerobic nitric oxide reductase flavorubredoxin n=3 Tax=Kosmotogaceae TaxID=1643948 RepID=UPI001BD1CFB9|nr:MULTISPECIES: anaerobic nitric oxide reductase flavorubredoxin [Mesotoga]MCP5456411.1 anaerobic nitric oxide reductase flavorubredoxin [Thermotogota bacterium]MCB1223296.1 anaerobic nitric oxide reductase flavorubredoxin [Mesotoga sp.]MCP5460865.1 anaerobic nitric oxide reductase flavorubredoxin [Thermotogota bacterium]HOP36730.1 anaerobic nitric oxide reductase flavorubredoxin [Mesotoga prima]HOZ99535.1 anaerobic nitric oxide reductase flavorubredoxin [Mesotoga prima]